MKYVFIALLWAGYCALHSYLISIGFTTLMTRLLKRYYAFYRLFYVLVSLALIIPLMNFTAQADNEIIVHYSRGLDIVRYVLISGSLLMFFWAFFLDYDSLSFFGIRQVLNMGKTVSSGAANELKKSGLLGMMRHPMYFALIIYLWCNVHTMADIVVFAVLTVYIFIGTLIEEKKLVLEFGETYIKYQEEVPMLIPFLKGKRK
jgi:methanethiol S-methyltransferase